MKLRGIPCYEKPTNSAETFYQKDKPEFCGGHIPYNLIGAYIKELSDIVYGNEAASVLFLYHKGPGHKYPYSL